MSVSSEDQLLSSPQHVAKVKNLPTVTKHLCGPEAADRSMALRRRSLAPLLLLIPPTTPVQAAVYSYFVPQPQANSQK